MGTSGATCLNVLLKSHASKNYVSSSTTYAYYVRMPGGELLNSFDAEGSGVKYYHFDGLGSTVMVSNGSGTTSASNTYDAWGAVLSYSGSGSKPYEYVGELGYYAHTSQGSALADLLQLGVRFYDPELGRFTQRDPIIGREQGAYRYAEGIPTSVIDPTGAIWCQWVKRGKTRVLDCNWGKPPKDLRGAFTPPFLDCLINRLPFWAQSAIRVFDLAADTGGVIDAALMCNDSSPENLPDPDDPLYRATIAYCLSKGIKNCDVNGPQFRIQCTAMASYLDETLKAWAKIPPDCWKKICKGNK